MKQLCSIRQALLSMDEPVYLMRILFLLSTLDSNDFSSSFTLHCSKLFSHTYMLSHNKSQVVEKDSRPPSKVKLRILSIYVSFCIVTCIK